MKKLIISCLLSAMVLTAARAQYGTARTGYEGDYFSLEGALDLFRQSYSLQDFERKLNTEENWVNNLDLNYDGRIDYIRVEHRRQGNFHAVILQALVDRYDIQDVAVIEIELIGPREAVLQIVGDEDLYGEEVIVEPVEGYADSRRGYHSDYGDYVNVYYWQPVQFMLDRQYTVYASPYRWQYYPVWWRPWIQCSWSVFRPRVVVYQRYFHVVRVHRVIRVHHFYRPYRTYSYDVVQRTNRVRVEHGRAPVYREAPAGRAADYPGRREATAPRSIAPGERAPVSRERATVPADQRPAGSRSTRQPADSRSTQPALERSTPSGVRPPSRNQTPRPEVTPRSTTPERNAPSEVRPPSRNQTASPAATPRSRTYDQNSSSRPAPAAQPRTERSTPASVSPPSRNQTARPAETPRSRTYDQNSSSRPAPAAQPRTERSAPASVSPPSRNQAPRPAVAPRSASPERKAPAARSKTGKNNEEG